MADETQKKRRTTEEIAQVAEKVYAEIQASSGGEYSAKDVLKRHGLDASAYYGWRKRKATIELGERRKAARAKAVVPAPIHHTFPIEVEKPSRAGDYLIIKGSPEALARFFRKAGDQ